jgi:20S proteasome subunit alpha 2
VLMPLSLPNNVSVSKNIYVLSKKRVIEGVRPFGCSCMLAGYDDTGPSLYQIDPSGAYFKWKASALGKNYINSKTFLEKRYNEDLDLDDAVHTALLTLKEGFEGAMDENNIQVAVCTPDKGFKLLSPADVKDYLQEVE